MPRYYLNIKYPSAYHADNEGSEFPDLEAACDEAVLSARCILGHALRQSELHDFGVFQVADSNGLILAEVTFIEALGF